MRKPTRVMVEATVLICMAVVALGCRRMLRERGAEPMAAGGEARTTGLGAGDHELSVEVQGAQRLYIVHAPPSYQPGRPMPLVVNFHGGGGSPEGHVKLSRMDDAADRHGFIVAYPRGTHPDGDAKARFKRFWNPGPGPQGNYSSSEFITRSDDVAYVRAMLDAIERDFTIDAKRVFAAGFSNGGMITHRVACDLSDRIAAIASVSGPFWHDPGSCNPTRPVPFIFFQGTADPCAPIQGGVGECERGISSKPRDYPSAEYTLGVWKEKDHCTGEPAVTYQRGETTCRTYRSCARGSEVEFCSVGGGGHTWPGGTTAWIPGMDMGKLSKDIDANESMWEFFARHPLD